jgi:hypothetical protein
VGALIEGVLELIGGSSRDALWPPSATIALAQALLGMLMLSILATAFVLWRNWGAPG